MGGLQDIEGSDNGKAGPPEDASGRLRALILEICGQLRRGLHPGVETGGLPGPDAMALTELAALVGQVTRTNTSFRTALDAMRDSLVIFGPDLRTIYANTSLRTFFQRTTQVEVGVHFHALVDAVVRHDLVDLPADEIHAWRDRVTGGDGSPLTVKLSSGQTYRWHMRRDDDTGNHIFIATDLSREVKRQTQLERANLQARQAIEAKATFLTHMSHELRTPMNGVIGMAELLCDSGLDTERQRYAETIRNSAEALLEIINSVLDYASGRSGALRMTECSFDLERLAAEVVTLLQPAAAAKGLDLLLAYDPLTARCWHADLGRMRQVIVNLVGNAVKYTHAGSVRLVILRTPEGLSILVEDSGPGIPDDRIDSIFEEFSQLAEPGVTGISGTGLGLTITDHLVEAMGGRLWVTSTPGLGSTFGVNLVLRQAAVQPPVVVAPDMTAPVLVVRDAPLLNRQMCRIFSRARILHRIVPDLAAAQAAVADGLTPPVVIVACSRDQTVCDDTIAWCRGTLPRAQLWLVTPTTRRFVAADRFDHVLKLPLRHIELTEPIVNLLQERSRPGPGPVPGTATRRMRVLAADDNATNRLVIEKMLRHCDIDLIQASDGQQAVDLWRRQKPDLILMDISMPVMDGREAAQTIRQAEAAERLARTQIVAVTANAAEEQATCLMESGVDAVVTKPVRRATLLDLLVRHAPGDAVAPVPHEASPATVPGQT